MASIHCWIVNVPGHGPSDLSCDLNPGRLTSDPTVTGHLLSRISIKPFTEIVLIVPVPGESVLLFSRAVAVSPQFLSSPHIA